jgi:hypothetical protein
LEDARRSLTGGSRSTAITEALLRQIDGDKKQTRSLIVTAIEGSWIGYAKSMGLVCTDPNTPASRQLCSMTDLRSAIKEIPVIEDRMAALYFITSYTRDVLYSQVMWGGTHQAAVEDYVMDRMGAIFATPRTKMQPGTKTCVGQLYGQVYNQKKHKLYASTLPQGWTLAIGCKESKPSQHWKRPKEIYFVKNITAAAGSTLMEEVTTKTVSAYVVCTRNTLQGGLTIHYCFLWHR